MQIMYVQLFDEIKAQDFKLPLKVALKLSREAIDSIQHLPISKLGLNDRIIRRLNWELIATVGQLLDLSVRQLFQLKGIAQESIQQIIQHVQSPPPHHRIHTTNVNTHYRVVNARRMALLGNGYTPLTLGDEWDLHSWHTAPPPDLTNIVNEISAPFALDVVKHSGNNISCLLNWSWSEARQLLGEDIANELLNALVTIAIEAREAASRGPAQGMDMQRDRQAIEAELTHRRVDQLNLSLHALNLLKNSAIFTIQQLLHALSPPIPALCIDRVAFQNIWDCLVELGIRSGDASAEWEQTVTPLTSTITLDELAITMQIILKVKEWAVLCMRYGLYDAQPELGPQQNIDGALTLREVSIRIGITPQRVRQIERRALLKLAASKHGIWHGLSDTLYYSVGKAGGSASTEEVAHKIAEQLPHNSTNVVGLCHLLMDLHPGLISEQKGRVFKVGVLQNEHLVPMV